MLTDVDARKVEVLKVWYAIFVAIMDKPDTDEKDMALLRKLRDRLRREAPELESN
jgi:hypothetical protein